MSGRLPTRVGDSTQQLRLLAAVDAFAREDPDGRCDESALAERLGWTLQEAHRALFDARLAGYVTGRTANLNYLVLTDIRLTPHARAVLARHRADAGDLQHLRESQ